MNVHVKIAAALVVLGLLAAAGYKYLWPRFEARAQIDTTDARGTKGRIAIGVDNWVGYFPLCSDEMRKRMRTAGYVLHCEDDKADYPKRFANVKSQPAAVRGRHRRCVSAQRPRHRLPRRHRGGDRRVQRRRRDRRVEGQGRLARRTEGARGRRPLPSRPGRRASICCVRRPCISTSRRCAAARDRGASRPMARPKRSSACSTGRPTRPCCGSPMSRARWARRA